MTSAVESVTVAVRDLDAAVALFGGKLGLKTESDSRASVSLLGAWRYPVHADVRLVELSSSGYAFGRLRLVHFAPAVPIHSDAADASAEQYPHLGPATLDINVGTPADEVKRTLAASGFESLPDECGETLYRNSEGLALRLIVADKGARSAPAPGCIGEIVRICVLTEDATAAERFYRDALGLIAADTVPPSFKDRQQSSGAIQVRRIADSRVPTQLHAPMPGHRHGINLLSLRCSDLDALEQRLRAHNAEIITRPTHVALGDGIPARVMLVRGPSRELLELLERDT